MSETCSICLESYFVNSDTHDKRKFVTKCNHVYHHDCIYRWAQQNNSCPTCRTGNLIDEFIINIYDYHDDNDFDSLLSSIRSVRLNIGNYIDDHSLDNLTSYNGYLDNLTDLFTNYYRNSSNNNYIEVINLPFIQNNSISNNVIILPDNPPSQQVNNLRMGFNNYSRQSTNHRLSSMNFR